MKDQVHKKAKKTCRFSVACWFQWAWVLFVLYLAPKYSIIKTLVKSVRSIFFIYISDWSSSCWYQLDKKPKLILSNYYIMPSDYEELYVGAIYQMWYTIVVYLDKRLGAGHPKRWLK